jgi:hypothetical protein
MNCGAKFVIAQLSTVIPVPYMPPARRTACVVYTFTSYFIYNSHIYIELPTKTSINYISAAGEE